MALFIYAVVPMCYHLFEVVKMNLRDTRNSYGISQSNAAEIVGVPLRTYKRYESDDNYGDSLKRKSIIDSIINSCEITESKGLLSIEKIKDIITELFDNEYKGKVDFCYLFGSYAKGTAKEESDVDLYVFSSLTGLRFVGLIERLRQVLHKKVDVIRSSELNNELANEIMKDGIKIYY